MTRKDYVLIAYAINNVYGSAPTEGPSVEGFREALDSVAKSIARSLKAYNGNFDMYRFLDACGVEEV